MSGASKRASEDKALAALSALGGGIVILGTWLFYRERLVAPAGNWLAWLQPTLLAIGGVLALIAAAQVATRRPGGRETLRLALSVVPVILATRLIVVGVRVLVLAAGWLWENAATLSPGTVGAAAERLVQSPRNLANLIVVALIVLVAAVATALATKERRDEGGAR